jgi:hypothetical protein
MLTLPKLKIYTRFDGDIDGWARAGTQKEKTIMTDDDWFAIDGFIDDICLAKKGFASEEFSQTLKERLIRDCSDEDVIVELYRMANTIC